MTEHKALKFHSQIKTNIGFYEIQIWGKSYPEEKDRSLEAEWEILKEANREKFLAFLEQEHRDNLLFFKEPPQGFFLGKGDAVYTRQKNFLCTVRSADCVPILGYSLNSPLCFAIHAGWRGLELNIIEKTLLNFKNEIPSMFFFIGPHIYYQNYEVGEDVFSKFHSSFYERNGDKAYLKLTSLALHALFSLGVTKKQISFLYCNTYKSQDFFSHRSAEKGRNLSAICYLGSL